MALPNLPAALSVAISQATVAFGSTSSTHTFNNPIQNYQGEELHVNASSDGTTLTLHIGDQVKPSPAAHQDATRAIVQVTYQGIPSDALTFGSIDYKAGSKINFGVQVDAQWATASVNLNNLSLVGGQASLDYVLVYDAAGPDEPAHYDMYWLSSVALFDPGSIAGATFVPDPGGGFTGPFGISLP